MKINEKKNKGITLIALVITIIVLLILAGVTIASLSGDNGILTRAIQAKEMNKKGEVIDRARIDIAEKQLLKEDLNITEEEFKEILLKYGTLSTGAANINEETLTTKENYNIPVKDIYEIKIIIPSISTTESYVGKYADIDDNGSIDGIIFVDIAADTGEPKTWSTNGKNTRYQINKPEGNQGSDKIYKEYYIKEVRDNEIDPINPIKVVKPKPEQQAEKKDRFYVMALKDYENETLTWFFYAIGKMPEPVKDTLTGCGYAKIKTGQKEEEKIIGRHNTLNMIDIATTGKWKDTNNGNKGIITSSNDIWLKLQKDPKVTEGKWFLPSKDEWAAYAGELKIGCGTNDNGMKSKYSLKDWYWSSSQCNTVHAWNTFFNVGSIVRNGVNCDWYVRLAATF